MRSESVNVGRRTTDTKEDVRRAALSATLATVVGFAIGAFLCPTWQVAVETAQVRAGLVEYPAGNSFHIYHLHAWTLLHQLMAVVLSLGVSEAAVSAVVSGALTGLTFGGVALLAYALSRRLSVSIFAPVLWYSIFETGNAYGVTYPIFIAGTHHTYGIAGRALAVWLVALFAVRAYRSAMFLAGLALAIHLIWGACAIAVCALALAVSRTDLRPIRNRWPWLLLGGAITAASRIDHLWQRGRLPDADAEAGRELVRAFLEHWDVHRVAADMLAPGAILALAAVAFAAYVLRARREGDNRFPTAALLVAGIIGAAGLLITSIGDVLPAPVQAAMPGRFANLALVLLPAFLVPLPVDALNSQRNFRIALVGLGGYLAYGPVNLLFEQYLASDKYGWDLPHWVAALAMMAVIAAAVSRRGDDEVAAPGLDAPVIDIPVLAVTVILVGAAFWSRPAPTGIALTNDDAAVWAAARQSGATLITGPRMELVQLRSRRPVMLNTGGLDQLPYVPASGPDMDRVLRSVYGIDLQDPPRDIGDTRAGALPEGAARDLFESRTTADWLAVKQEQSVEGPLLILTAADWRLKLPLVAQSEGLRLYGIPGVRRADETL